MANNKLKVTAIIQARVNSKRFPNKVLNKIGNLSIIEFIIKRLNHCNLIEDVLVAIPIGKENDDFYNYLNSKKIDLLNQVQKDSIGIHIRRGDFWQSEVKGDNLNYNASPNDLFYKNIIKKLLNSSDKIIYIY